MNKNSGLTLPELVIALAIVGASVAVMIPQYKDYVTRNKWEDNVSFLTELKRKINHCLEESYRSFTACDSMEELGLTSLPKPVYALDAVRIVPDSAAIVFTGNAEVGSYVYAAAPVYDPSGTKITWQRVPNTDTIPGKILSRENR